MELFCQALRTTRQAREARLHLDAVYSNKENITFDLEFCLNSQEEMRTEARRKNLLILILHYLIEEGYVDAANALEQETKLGLRGFEVCDNIDLETILMEYESYYFVKFQKYPKITKKVLDTAENKQQLRSGGRAKRTASSSQNVPRVKQQTVQRAVSKTSPGSTTEPKSSTKGSPRQNSDGADTLDQSDFGLSISGIRKTGVDSSHPRKGQIIDFHKMIQDAVRVSPDGIPLNSLNYDPDPSERLLKPLSAFIGMTGEMRELAMVVSKDIYLHKPNVKWDDIIGLDAAKRLVKEAVVYPIKYPELFTGILSPWKGLLLYGPPGTGKTLLAKAVATECNTTFFNISASTIVSKWRGDSEKLVRVLFELARYHAPSTIFLDELESVMSQRGTAPGELDSAMLRRLEKRILVDLPSEEARRVMIQHWLPPLSNSGGVKLRTDLDYSLLSQETNGYSGSDIKLVCKEAAMRPVRKIFDALENHQPGNSNLPMIQLDTITTADFLDVITHTKPSAKNLSQKYTAWQREFESV
ncbi:katanin p60 ATPase-containing subunit A-like 2 isoform X12 [Corvus moneduloides]|uniref:katanin p60 ATPase-containing subunit A-like 2 isoform X12 n=1 Tax=Corvus moneduloides TaxID=1196302 RepID=UPI001363A1A7|nr:katanin p60 ATPase-containing subunit A-like 2 isoform X12 [Corvus moneduloides]